MDPPRQEKHALALLGFFTTTGLLSVVAAVFTNTVPMPAGLRDICLIICVITFGLLVIGITLFFLKLSRLALSRVCDIQ